MDISSYSFPSWKRYRPKQKGLLFCYCVHNTKIISVSCFYENGSNQFPVSFMGKQQLSLRWKLIEKNKIDRFQSFFFFSFFLTDIPTKGAGGKKKSPFSKAASVILIFSQVHTVVSDDHVFSHITHIDNSISTHRLTYMLLELMTLLNVDISGWWGGPETLMHET